MKRLFVLWFLVLSLFISGSALADVLNLPAGIKIIEEEAFSGDTSLEEVVVPEGAEIIGSRAFADSSLKQIGLPLSMTHIAEDAFENVKNLVAKAIFGSYAYDWAKEHGYFVNESPLSDFTFHIIDDETCGIEKYNGSDAKVVIPSRDHKGRQVVKIENNAFYGNKTLTGVFIPEGVTEICASAFDGCASLCDVVFPDTITTIGQYAFYACNTASDIRAYYYLPAGITSVYSDLSFTGNIVPACDKFSPTAHALSAQGINFSAQGEEDFLYRYREEHLYLVKYIGTGSIAAIPQGIYGIYEAFQGNKTIAAVSIPEGTVDIGYNSFDSCSALSTVIFPSTIETIGQYAFYKCNTASETRAYYYLPAGITSVYSDLSFTGNAVPACDKFSATAHSLSAQGINFSSRDEEDFLYRYMEEKLYLVSYIGTSPTAVIPHGIYGIYQAFQGNKTIASVSIPEDTEDIGYNAFDNCSILSTVIFPSTIKTIGQYAFYKCNTASDTRAYYYLPAGITSVYSDLSFTGNILPACDKFSSTAHALSTQGISFSSRGEEDFVYRYMEDHLFLVNYVGAGTFVSIPQGIYGIYQAFQGNKTIASVSIPVGTVEIGYNAFDNCSALSSVIFPSTIKTIGQYAFYACNTNSQWNSYYYLPNNITKVYSDLSFTGMIKLACLRGSSTEQALIDAGLSYVYILSAPVVVPVPPVIDEEEAAQEEQEKIEEAEEQQDRPLTEDELTEIFKSIGRTGLVSILETADDKENDRVSKYYVDHLSEFADIMNVLEKLLNGKYTDIVFSGEKKTKYLFSQALRMMDESDTFQFVKIDLKDSELYDIAHDGPEAALDIYFEHLAEMGFPAAAAEFLASNKDFEELFKKYANGEIGQEGVEAALAFMIKPEELGKNVDDIMKSMEQYKGINKMLKTMGNIAEAAGLADRVMEIANQVNILQSLDDASLRRVADIYLNSDDEAVRAVGYTLQSLAGASDIEILAKVAAGQFLDYGLDKAVKAMVKAADASYIALDISNFIVNEFTGADKVAGLVDKVKWANDAADIAYDSYRSAQRKYEKTQSDDDLEALYRSMKIYYGTAAQAEEALLNIYEEIDNSMLGDLWIRQDYRTMMEQLQGEVDYYRKTADYATLEYEYWQSGDLDYFRSTLAQIGQKYARQ